MRALTIERKKKFAGNKIKLSIYMQSALNGDIDLLGEKVLLLGSLKNGKQMIVNIPDEEVVIFFVLEISVFNISDEERTNKYIIKAGNKGTKLILNKAPANKNGVIWLFSEE